MERDRPENLREEEAFAESQIYYLFTHTQEMISSTTRNLSGLTHSAPVGLPGSSEFLARLKFEVTNLLSRGTNDVLEIGVLRLLGTVRPERRQDVLQRALINAKEYWEELIKQPDNPTDVIMRARMSLTQISEKLDALQKPKEK